MLTSVEMSKDGGELVASSKIEKWKVGYFISIFQDGN
jgi:hypothetical protein